MALNLLSSYGSDDESDFEEPASSSVGQAAEDEPSTSSSTKLSGECTDSNSDSNTESETDSPVKNEPLPSVDDVPPLKKRRLPSVAEAFSIKSKTGVLVNDYERAVLDHEAMLSKHVPLSDPKKTKPVCKAFRRGMCRRGKNCRYDHPPEEAPTPDMSKAVLSAPVQYTTANDVYKSRPVRPRR